MPDLPALTLRDVRVRPVVLTPDQPVETAAGRVAQTCLVLIDLVADEGVTGRSYLRSYSPLAHKPLATLVGNIASQVLGAALAPDQLDEQIRRHFALMGTSGLIGLALAGLDMAAWDALAVAAAVPLARLLGAEPAAVRAYATLRPMQPAGRVAAAAEEAAAAGFPAVKVKLGSADLPADLGVLRAVRSAVGDATVIMIDYNQSLSVDEAITRIAALEPLGLEWVEEPTRSEDVDGHARIAAAVRTPVQLGENWHSTFDVDAAARAGACRLATFDAARIGGVTGWRRCLPATAGRPVSSHAYPEISAHLLASTPVSGWLEDVDHAGPVLAEPVSVRHGFVRVPEQPGSGIGWDEQAVARASL